MKVCRPLADKLLLLAAEYNTTVDEVWRQVLFEIPDEALEQFHLMSDSTELEVSEDTAYLTAAIADDFGMTVLGMSVLMDKLMTKVLKVNNKLAEYEREADKR